MKAFLLAERKAPVRYAAAAALAIAFLALLRLVSWLEGTQLSSLAMVAVALSAIYGGIGPALVAAAIAAVGIDYFFADPLGRIFDSWGSFLRVLTYGLVGLLVGSIVATLRDAYRELHTQYRETEEAKRARESTQAIVSHDLRSSLAAILLGITYVKHTAKQGAQIAELMASLDAIHRSAEMMKRLVDDLVDAAAIDSGRLRIAPLRQDVAPIVRDAVEAGRLAASGKRIRLELGVPPAPCPARADRQRLAQVLANLIGNAVKFSPEGATVRVVLRAEDKLARIDVTDSGPGIAEEDLTQLFSRYWQARDTAHLGTGLGLFIARSIIEAHGGRIEARSAPGQGATFSIFLPADEG